jgi:1-acyl-sn-glycerol-3-phosphate acyltransferase
MVPAMPNQPGPTSPLPRRGNAFTRWLGRTTLRLLGWRTEGAFPDRSHLVVIAAPHSSGWDFVIGIAFMMAIGVRIRFIGKTELFRGPVGWLLRTMGGVPVDRANPEGIIDQVVGEFNRTPGMVLGLAPEGTRRHGARWKTGFYRIAAKARVPIVPGFFDWSRKTVGLLPAFAPTGDMPNDIAAIQELYASFTRRDGLTIAPGARA